ncbi:MAG TPA: monofunctional biosynthetic peptidoglycan transglycosylase [Thermodesulfobacteriota bacterium]|nr:monofunctional biosynthetic peptidoglycan transglycosylase [Thermodesulfobacteriota bacterium]
MRRLLNRVFISILKLILYFLLITLAWVLIYRFVNPPVTPLMVIRYFQSETPDRSIHKTWKDYNDISENLALAVIAAEDQKFFEHNGFDIESILEAVEEKRNGKRPRGASTISQQVAKNVFLWPSRTWLRKGLESYFTFLVELLWDKKRILEVYLNVAEMGNGIYGAEAAAQAYFKKPAKKLSKNEAALIAAVLPNPRRMSPARPSAYVYERQRWILKQMSNLGSVELLSEGGQT